jgi:cytochrome c biogenesis protein ResB
MLKTFSVVFRFFASMGLSVALLLLLMLLTFLGTIQQVNQGLYEVQREYFGSMFLVHWVGGVFPLPLPGAYLLMAIAFVNVACGGIVRARKGWRTAGVLVAHVGILMLLFGAFVTHTQSVRGNLTLYEGDQSDRFQSYEQWELSIASAKGSLIIPGNKFEGLTGDKSRVFVSSSLPFDLTISGYAANAEASSVTAGNQGGGRVVDGRVLKALSPDREPERNAPAAILTMKDKTSGASEEHIVSAMDQELLKINYGGDDWTVSLGRRSWPLPFTIRLDKFTHELHPGTNMPKSFMSDVTKIEGGSEQSARISMNEPLRSKGYTLYQASWGPSNAGPKERLFSTFAVVRNPAEAIPLWACSIIGVGLSIHFIAKLFSYLRKQRRVQA